MSFSKVMCFTKEEILKIKEFLLFYKGVWQDNIIDNEHCYVGEDLLIEIKDNLSIINRIIDKIDKK